MIQDPGPGDWRFWGKFEEWEVPMELHVPCREPIDHLLSQVPASAHSFHRILSSPPPDLTFSKRPTRTPCSCG